MNNLWKERKYVDVWSLSHLLFGASLAVFSIWWHVDFMLSVVFCAALFILWEFIEYKTHVGETVYNQMGDIIIAMIGFFAFYVTHNAIVAALLIFIFFVLETGGYWSKIQEAHTPREKKLNATFMVASWVYVIFYIIIVVL